MIKSEIDNSNIQFPQNLEFDFNFWIYVLKFCLLKMLLGFLEIWILLIEFGTEYHLISSIDALTYVIGLSQSFKLDELDPWYSSATVIEIADLKYIKYVRKSWLPVLCWIAIIEGVDLNFQIDNVPSYHASLYTFTK